MAHALGGPDHTLPAGIFDDLTALQTLYMGAGVAQLPAGSFDRLGRLEYLNLETNELETLPPGIFDRLGRLDELELDGNELTALRDGVFGKLTSVRYLDVEENPGYDTFVPVADAGGDLQAEPGAAVTLAGNATGPWGANVLWSWEQVDSGGNAPAQPTVTLAGADTPAPSFSAPDAPATLHFKVTVTARGTIYDPDVDRAVEPITGTDTVTVRVGPAVTDTLAALALADPGGVALALSPQFSASTLAYSAAAPPGADRVTLMARPSHPAARVSFGPEADAAPAPGHQAALGAPGSVTRVTATAVSDSGGESMVYGVDVKRAETDVCRRTGAVRDAIVAAVAGVSDCADLTPAQLARIGVLDVSNRKVPALAAGDFAGLAGLTRLDLGNPGNDRGPMQSLPAGIFDGLAALTALDLSGNALAALPPGLFDRLTGLTELRLADNALTELPGGVFNRLTALTALVLSGNGLAALPPGLFDRLTGLTELRLAGNALAGLPAGVFDRLTALTALDLSGNRLAALRPGLFDRLTGLTTLRLADNALAALPDVIFERLTALRKFSIANNPGAAAFLPNADAGPDRAVAAGTAGMTLGRLDQRRRALGRRALGRERPVHLDPDGRCVGDALGRQHGAAELHCAGNRRRLGVQADGASEGRDGRRCHRLLQHGLWRQRQGVGHGAGGAGRGSGCETRSAFARGAGRRPDCAARLDDLQADGLRAGHDAVPGAATRDGGERRGAGGGVEC